MDFSKFPEWLKLSPKYLFPIWLITAFALFAPVDVSNIFGLTSLVSQFRPHLGIAFLLSTGLLLTNWLASGFDWFGKKFIQKRNLKSMQKRLRFLTEEEKRILRGYIDGRTRTQNLSVYDGIVNGLELEKIIFKASHIGQLDEWPYNIQPWAWDYLQKHPYLLTPHPTIDRARDPMAKY